MTISDRFNGVPDLGFGYVDTRSLARHQLEVAVILLVCLVLAALYAAL